MKTTSITVERNFHIMNDDRFIMEKISWTVELDETDDPHDAIDIARSHITDNFKHAYPKVYTHLNFHVVRDYSNDINSLPNCQIPTNPTIEVKVNGAYGKMLDTNRENQVEKIKQIPLEEQIQSCKTVDELNSFTLIAGMNTKLQEQYHRKLKELEIKDIMERTEALRKIK